MYRPHFGKEWAKNKNTGHSNKNISVKEWISEKHQQ
jgi:hypothetical protein